MSEIIRQTYQSRKKDFENLYFPGDIWVTDSNVVIEIVRVKCSHVTGSHTMKIRLLGVEESVNVIIENHKIKDTSTVLERKLTRDEDPEYFL